MNSQQPDANDRNDRFVAQAMVRRVLRNKGGISAEFDRDVARRFEVLCRKSDDGAPQEEDVISEIAEGMLPVIRRARKYQADKSRQTVMFSLNPTEVISRMRT